MSWSGLHILYLPPPPLKLCIYSLSCSFSSGFMFLPVVCLYIHASHPPSPKPFRYLNSAPDVRGLHITYPPPLLVLFLGVCVCTVCYIWELTVLCYHRIRVNHPYPFLGVNFWVILHDFIRQNYHKNQSNRYPFPLIMVNYLIFL